MMRKKVSEVAKAEAYCAQGTTAVEQEVQAVLYSNNELHFHLGCDWTKAYSARNPPGCLRHPASAAYQHQTEDAPSALHDCAPTVEVEEAVDAPLVLRRDANRFLFRRRKLARSSPKVALARMRRRG